jgi:hypothetical protein
MLTHNSIYDIQRSTERGNHFLRRRLKRTLGLMRPVYVYLGESISLEIDRAWLT